MTTALDTADKLHGLISDLFVYSNLLEQQLLSPCFTDRRSQEEVNHFLTFAIAEKATELRKLRTSQFVQLSAAQS